MISVKNLSKSYKLDNGEEVEALKNINIKSKKKQPYTFKDPLVFGLNP